MIARFRRSVVLLLLIFLVSLASADQHQLPFLSHVQSEPAARPPRVAIIGAGPGGSFAAFALRFLATQHPHLATNASIFERSDYVGGRSTIIDLPGDNGHAELGASIFVKANKNLWKAAQTFNLTLQNGHGGGSVEDSGVAIYDGESFVYQEAKGSWWSWNMIKLLWKYGRAPLKLHSLVGQTVATFTSLYGSDFQAQGPFATVPEFARALDVADLYAKSVDAHLAAQSIYKPFVDDFVGAAVRVNYAQTPASIHALEGLVALAAEGASSVVAGNLRLFELFVANSGASLHVQTPIEELVRLDDGRWLVRGQGVFDVVLLAAPYHQSGVRIAGTDHAAVPKQAYIHLHVTLVITTAHHPKGGFFSTELEGKAAPAIVLSTFAYTDAGLKRRPRLNSHNYLRKLDDGSYVVKLFSENEVDDDLLDDLFGLDTVKWVHRHEWDAYPSATSMHDEDFAPFELAPGLFYLNAFEPLISCMETATISAWNIAGLVMERLFKWQSEKSWAEWSD